MSNPYMPLTKLDKALDAAAKAENDRAIADGPIDLPAYPERTEAERRAYAELVQAELRKTGAFDFLGL